MEKQKERKKKPLTPGNKGNGPKGDPLLVRETIRSDFRLFLARNEGK